MSRVSLIEQLYAPKKKSALEFNYDALWAPPIRCFLTQQDINQLYKIATSLKYNDNIEKKYELIDAIMRPRGFKRGNCGTNRVVYNFLEDTSFCMKIALDRVGINDSPREYKNQEFFKPFCCKIFEVDPTGVIACVERVNPISSLEEFVSIADDVFNMMITKIIGKYVVDDLGTEKYLNYGIRYNSNGVAFGPVVLDYPYAYELDGAKLRCAKPIQIGNKEFACGGEIDYDSGLNNLICCKCGRTYSARELAKDDSNVLKFYSDDDQCVMRARIVREDGTIVKDSGRSSKIYVTREEYEEGTRLFEVKNFEPRRVEKTIKNKYVPMKKLREQYYTELQAKAYEEMQKRNAEPFNPVIESEFGPRTAKRATKETEDRSVLPGGENIQYSNNEYIKLQDTEYPRVRVARRAEDVFSQTPVKFGEMETFNDLSASEEMAENITMDKETGEVKFNESINEECHEESDDGYEELDFIQDHNKIPVKIIVNPVTDCNEIKGENQYQVDENTESEDDKMANDYVVTSGDYTDIVLDEAGNAINYKDFNGVEYWKQYDENDNEIYYKDSDGYEVWHEYDANNNEIHCKDSNGYEVWYEYDESGNLINTIENTDEEESEAFSDEMEADVFPEISSQMMGAALSNEQDYSDVEYEESNSYEEDEDDDYSDYHSNHKHKKKNKKQQKARTKRYNNNDDMSDY